MDIVKIQQELIKDMNNESVKFCTGWNGESVYVTYATRAYIIPKDKFVIELNRLPKAGFTHQSLYRNVTEGEEAINTGEKYVCDKGKFAIFKGTVFSKIYINVKDLKNFDRKCTLLVKTPRSIVYVFERGKCVGAIMPYVPDNK